MYAVRYKNCGLFFGSKELRSSVVVDEDSNDDKQYLRDIDAEAHAEGEREYPEVYGAGLECERLGIGEEAESCRAVDESAEEASEHNSAYREE